MKRLTIDGINKSFKQRKVVKGVSFGVQSGQVVGLLGPNEYWFLNGYLN